LQFDLKVLFIAVHVATSLCLIVSLSGGSWVWFTGCCNSSQQRFYKD